jgi:cell wall-associated NlpC family hydrolase
MDILEEAAALGMRWGRPDGEIVSRSALIAEARSWIGTPFHHQGCLKGVGVDCGGLVRGVSVALGLLPPDYATLIPRRLHGYGRYPNMDMGRRLCDVYWTPIEREEMQPADVIVIAFDSDPQHTAILVPYAHGGLGIVHAAMKGVIETRLLFGTSPRSMKFVAAYKLPGVA